MSSLRRRAALAGCAAVLPAGLLTAAAPASAAVGIDLVPVASYASSSGAVPGGTEIVAFDPTTRRAFTTNDAAGVTRVDVADLEDASEPVLLAPIDLARQGATGVQSVAVAGGVLAVAVTLSSPQQPGAVLLYDTATLELLRSVTVGALPDAVTFTPDGARVVVSNEGESACAGTTLVNPEGSVSVITVTTGAVATARFTQYDTETGREQLLAAGVRLDPSFGPRPVTSSRSTPPSPPTAGRPS